MRNVLVITACVGFLASMVSAQLDTPRKMMMVLDHANVETNPDYTKYDTSVNFYDVTDLSGNNVFDRTPLFSVWLGYEITDWTNKEELETVAVNPANGTCYVSAYDSGPSGIPDDVGDIQGDWDLYRIDYQAILKDWEQNSRPRGQMYTARFGIDYDVDTNAYELKHPDHDGFDNITGAPDPTENVTVSIGEGDQSTGPIGTQPIRKIGELQRSQGGQPQSYWKGGLEFVNPERLVMLDQYKGTDDTYANDVPIRAWERTSRQPGTTGNATETWEQTELGLVNMDYADGAGTRTRTPEWMVYVERDGVSGIWVGESDGGSIVEDEEGKTRGDDIAFFEIDWENMTATKKPIRLGNPYPGTGHYSDYFNLSNDPTIDRFSNDGSFDYIFVDAEGNLVIGESGYFDDDEDQGTLKHHPKVITAKVFDYDADDSDSDGLNEVDMNGPDDPTAAWSVIGPMNPTLNDNGDLQGQYGPIDGRYVAFDKGSNQVYFYDTDGYESDKDIYVLDLNTGQLVYEELDAMTHLVNPMGMKIILRGDIVADGRIDANDVIMLQEKIAESLAATDPADAAVLGEWYDLTGDYDLNNDDVLELVEGVLGSYAGDASLDGKVTLADLSALAGNWNSTNANWTMGDFNSDGQVTLADLSALAGNWNAGVAPAAGTVPEPTTLSVLGLLGVLGVLRRRREQ